MKIYSEEKTTPKASEPNLQNLIHKWNVLMFSNIYLNSITGLSERNTTIFPCMAVIIEIILNVSCVSWSPEDDYRSQSAPELHC